MKYKSVVSNKDNTRYIFLYDFYSSQLLQQVKAKWLYRPIRIQDISGIIIQEKLISQKSLKRLSTQDQGLRDGTLRWLTPAEKAEQERKKNEKKREEEKLALERRNNQIIAQFETNNQFAKELKHSFLQHEEIKEYNAHCKCLMEHQKLGALIAEKRKRYGFFFDTGTGKTLLGLEIMSKCYESKRHRFLVICPKAIIQTAWLDDCEHFFPGMKIMPIFGGMTLKDYRDVFERWRKTGAEISSYTIRCFEYRTNLSIVEAKKLLMDEAQHFIVNPEKFRYDLLDFSGRDLEKRDKLPHQYRNIHGLIVDESAILKNPGTDIYVRVFSYSKKLEYTYLLSGKPAPNNIQEYKSQARIIADDYCSAILGKSYLRREINTQLLLETVEKLSLTISKQDCLQLPETVEVVREVQLSTKEYDLYRAIKHSTWQAIFSASDTEKQNPIFIQGNIMKLREIASGFLVQKENEPDNKDIITKVHTKKLDELLNIINELGDKQAIIWCQFRYEIEVIEEVLKHKGFKVSTAYGGTKDKYQNITDFKSGKTRFMIAHPSTLKYGVTLVNCSYAIYYSLSYSFEEYYQSHDRIFRKGQSLPCTFIFLNSKNTIDEIMYAAVHRKLKNSEWAEMVIRHLAQE